MLISRFRFALVFSLIAMFVVACTPEDGDTGPVGPVGPPGPAGGGSRVESYTFTVLNSDYDVYVGTSGTFFMHRDTLALNKINSDLVKEGSIQLFRKGTSSTSWNAMPYYRGGLAYNFSYDIGKVFIEVSYNNANAINIGDSDFKVVIVPSAAKVEGVDYDNYEMVRTVYDL